MVSADLSFFYSDCLLQKKLGIVLEVHSNTILVQLDKEVGINCGEGLQGIDRGMVWHQAKYSISRPADLECKLLKLNALP